MQSYTIRDNVLILDKSHREYVLKIRDIPAEDKPRAKLVSHGPESLSIKELLAVVLNTGSAKEDVLEFADRIVKNYGEKSLFSEKNANKLSQDMEIPLLKACQIVAMGELGRRLYSTNQFGFHIIRNANDAFQYLQDMRNLPKEHLRGLYLNSHNRVIKDEVISIGTVNSNMIHPREVFRPAIECNAAALILAHNHPSGDTSPSSADIEVTEQIIKAGQILGISVLDHIIITKDSFSSISANYQ